ncbi:MAG: hypothetical protein J6K61_06265 [Clostridia bacterium]|nr:hypothetical protein [Clostridia bacterium]
MCFSKKAALKKLLHEMFQETKGMQFFGGSTISSKRAVDLSYIKVVSETLGERSQALLGQRGAFELRYDVDKKDVSLMLVFDYAQGTKKAKCVDNTFKMLEGEGKEGSVDQFIHALDLCHVEDEDMYELTLKMNNVSRGKVIKATRFLFKKASVYLESLEGLFAEL